MAEAGIGVAAACPGARAVPHLGSVRDPWQLTAPGVRFLGWIYPAELLSAFRKGCCLVARFLQGKTILLPPNFALGSVSLDVSGKPVHRASRGAEPLLRQGGTGGAGSSDKALKIAQKIKENVFPLELNVERLLDFGVSQLFLHAGFGTWEPAQ